MGNYKFTVVLWNVFLWIMVLVLAAVVGNLYDEAVTSSQLQIEAPYIKEKANLYREIAELHHRASDRLERIIKLEDLADERLERIQTLEEQVASLEHRVRKHHKE